MALPVHITITYHPTSAWEMRDGSFFCTHEYTETEEVVESRFGASGYYQIESEQTFCIDCDEVIINENIDEREYLAEIQLMELLGK